MRIISQRKLGDCLAAGREDGIPSQIGSVRRKSMKGSQHRGPSGDKVEKDVSGG
jgi:hypothetical protein